MVDRQNDPWAARLKAAVYGEAVGDALGVPYEFRERDTFRCETMTGGGAHRRPAGTFSDDTSMMLATLDSFGHCGGRVNPDDLRERFRAWRYDGDYTADGIVFDVGIATDRALETGRGMTGEYDNGNGSLMRSIPLAFFPVSDDEIRESSAITHAHRISTDACVAYVHAARMLIDGRTAREAAAAIGFDRLWETPREEIESTGFVRHTLRAAFWCLTVTDSYADCVRTAVNLGLDTDTTAAVVGALAGIVYGFGGRTGIPDEWVNVLRGRDVIDRILDGAVDNAYGGGSEV
ncbi:ADP-ribosylglycohydrolase family protein [Bifidobacterium simiarum]|uniref:ADP-ribosylglycohydrolase n=1 Tax=Bifidobacterium simiarum TaxID=2045441 RepID=A0A2M9HC61_9BIFI|nr:ADP-ribosylglycohydrolase family protein [Bifidobacterium simiarum]MBT1166568.1 ADP-ribosylglycohydrolase family protein [Bifidobacterium simiarum]PJM74395.1 ADP-ribosylglycohydrolase [Bifidobacterium simiarum]